jgi:hypothetical protein
MLPSYAKIPIPESREIYRECLGRGLDGKFCPKWADFHFGAGN